MSETKKCRACGVDIQSNAPFGHCAKCLLELGFGTVPGDLPKSSDRSAIETVRYFGDYELLEQIGRGGMGIVHKARQQSLNRLVALKMISAGEFASPSAVQRFQIEAEAAAKLDHPNIVPIFEIGMHRGQHYFSMGFIEGRNLAEEIRDGKFRSPGSTPHEPAQRFGADKDYDSPIFVRPKSLGTKSGQAANTSSKSAARQQQLAVAQLMTTVARSVHYAHQRGVLHRDLKPSNILLDSVGQPHLTDFGLAKILEHETGVTRTAEVMGTPSYMSPEQAAGRELSTATDVYSLGAILYELLTGQPPFKGPSSAEILRQLAAQEPARPQSLNPFVDPDLATACLKCLEKDPLRRYDSAGALADDLENWIAGRPILARPVSAGEKFWRWCRREPALAGLGATVVLVILLGLVGTSWQAVRATRAEREQSRLRADAVKAGQNEAELRLKAEAEAQKSRHIAAFLEDMLKGVQPSVALGRDTIMLREILDKATTRLSGELKGQPLVEARLREILGGVYLELGEYAKAEVMFREALTMRKKLLGNEHSLVAESLSNLAVVLYRQGKLTEAETMNREALTMRKKLLGNEHLDVADSLGNLAPILEEQGKLAEAEAMQREALAMRKKLLSNEHPDVVGSLLNLAAVLSKQGKLTEAETMNREVLAMRRKLLGNEHPDVAASLNNLAGILREQNKLAEAETMHREALAMGKKFLGNEHPAVAGSLNNLAEVLHSQGKLTEAETMNRDVLTMRKKLLSNEHPDVAASVHNLAEVLKDQGKLIESEQMHREALTTRKKLLGDEHPEVVRSLCNLAVVLEKQDKLPEAEIMIRAALALEKKLIGNEHPDVARSLRNLALVLHRQGKLREAETMHREALTMQKKLLGNEDPAVAESLGNLALVLAVQGNLAEAETMVREALTMRKKLLGKDHPDVVVSLNNLASVLGTQGKLDEVEPLLLEKNRIWQQSNQVTAKDKRAGIEHLINFYFTWAATAPGGGKMQKALEWQEKLTQFDKAAREQKAGAKQP